jgi:glutathionylspermidine synthase
MEIVQSDTLDGLNAHGYVYQALAPMANDGGRTAVFGLWLIDGEPAGIGIRESAGLVTKQYQPFCPTPGQIRVTRS